MGDITELIKTFVILLAIIDPIGNLPVYISLTSHKTKKEHHSIIFKTSCASVALLTVSFLFGKYIVGFFGIQMPAFKLVGGFFLVYIAFTMLTDNKTSYLLSEEGDAKNDIALMPMTFPPVIVKCGVWKHDQAAFLCRSNVFSSTPSMNFTPLMTSANRLNPRSFRQPFSALNPSL